MTIYRPAGPDDAAAIAALHADSWQRHFRGCFTDTFLDGDPLADRLPVWTRRLSVPGPRRTIVADDHGHLAGFVHFVAGSDPQWGAEIDEIHIAHDRQRHGLGRELLTRAATAIGAGSPLYLWVFAVNQPAQSFYRAMGATVVETTRFDGAPAGVLQGTPQVLRMAWPDTAALIPGRPEMS
ncbi:GNAT family N-acetyltransferase [Actinoplanes awajinensis]|uniref:N-acetyltransferase domain-containing protein n=1 Tax=Actinoplanes awajinensis subsp. mycoplanecinus TaxID=135947 RepID=A0A101JPS7_9ACTN|nr:GNAT family N-acetyltransferase [Actinoplanes awajinensis]KUL30890.1 hypothetical protein ADL15_23320 [Actinoplanes awajinensis subsp. mycoplanecinus]